MKNPISTVIAALDKCERLKLLAITFDGAILRFVTSEDSGIQSHQTEENSVEEWLAKHGAG